MIEENLQILRKKLRFGQSELAEKLNLPARTYAGYERGERKPPYEMLILLAKNFDVNLNWLIADIGDMFNEPAPQNEQLESLVAQIVNKELKKRGLE